MQFIKKHWGNLLMLIFLALLFIPQTAMPIKVALNKVFAFSPSVEDDDQMVVVDDLSWRMLDLQGDKENLARSKGKLVLVNHWATWCPPCVAEMPSLQRLHQDYGHYVDFYFVSQEDPEVIQRFLQKNGWDLPVYRPAEAPPDLLSAQVLPTTYLIDQEGNIRIKETGAAKWDSETVRELLDRLR